MTAVFINTFDLDYAGEADRRFNRIIAVSLVVAADAVRPRRPRTVEQPMVESSTDIDR